MDFNVTNCTKFIEVVSDLPLLLTFKELPHVECCSRKKYIHNYLRKLLIAPCLCKAGFSLYISTK